MAAKRPTASDEVARGRLVSLEGFAFALPAKNGEWHDSHLGFQVSFVSQMTSMAECADSTPSKSIERVCVSPSSKEQICLLCAKVVSNNVFSTKVDDLRGPEKNKNLFQSRVNISQPRNP